MTKMRGTLSPFQQVGIHDTELPINMSCSAAVRHRVIFLL